MAATHRNWLGLWTHTQRLMSPMIQRGFIVQKKLARHHNVLLQLKIMCFVEISILSWSHLQWTKWQNLFTSQCRLKNPQRWHTQDKMTKEMYLICMQNEVKIKFLQRQTQNCNKCSWDQSCLRVTLCLEVLFLSFNNTASSFNSCNKTDLCRKSNPHLSFWQIPKWDGLSLSCLQGKREEAGSRMGKVVSFNHDFIQMTTGHWCKHACTNQFSLTLPRQVCA